MKKRALLLAALLGGSNLTACGPSDEELERQALAARVGQLENRVAMAERTVKNAEAKANKAQATAEAAQTTADQAQETAGEAQATAEDAKATAERAEQKADDVVKGLATLDKALRARLWQVEKRAKNLEVAEKRQLLLNTCIEFYRTHTLIPSGGINFQNLSAPPMTYDMETAFKVRCEKEIGGNPKAKKAEPAAEGNKQPSAQQTPHKKGLRTPVTTRPVTARSDI